LKPRDLADLLLLAALWGGSFLFMRHAAPAFGAVPLMWLRVVIASACLLPLLLARRQGGELRARAGVMAVMGLSNSALPFVLIAWATLSITAGLAAILNATTPIFTAVVAALWLRERLTPPRLVGLLLGLAGVVVLAADQADFKPGGSGWALLASLCAALSYGFAANYARRHTVGVPALVSATGSQVAAAAVLTPFALWLWPATLPGAAAWGSALALGVGCTALAYLLYFRLLARVGPARAVTVTYLVPLFATVWGALLLDEVFTLRMALGGAVVLAGTALATGVWPRRKEATSTPQ
jgi:drug/metabolite transporter (DMT)-like permease